MEIKVYIRNWILKIFGVKLICQIQLMKYKEFEWFGLIQINCKVSFTTIDI